MKGVISYFVFGSWWVSLCAAAMGLLTWLELTGTWWNAPLFVFILGSTLVIYNLNMISGLAELRVKGTESERHHWCMDNERLMKFTLGFGLVLTAVSVWFLNAVVWWLMIPLGIVALAYTVPVIRKNANKIRLREIGLWKIFIIAAVWVGMTVILPSVHLYGFEQIIEIFSWELALERGVFILAITIPFDIRDLVNDAKKEICTIPSTIGWKKSIVLSQLLLLSFLLLVWLRIGISHPYFIGYLGGTILTMLCVSIATPERSDYYCSFWVEGTMMLQFVAVLLCLTTASFG
ncbi:MAG: UbiA family prenyltransferase [Flavobacteriales bacterium]|jgi:4-hydroxybenzoate polyprenyltransferase|nr:UbiA family prenyltransferase [Flavobacteriales bacterium]